MQHAYRSLSFRRRLLFVGLIIALAGCVAIGVAFRQAPSRGARLAEARALWERRPFTHYRLVTEHAGGLEQCRQDVEVQDERVVAVLTNTCARGAVTIAGLFLEIERYDLTIGGQCGPNGCACDGPIDVDVIYDPQLGYPRQLQVRAKAEQRWQYLAYWQRLLSGGGCTLIGFSGPSIDVVSITPSR